LNTGIDCQDAGIDVESEADSYYKNPQDVCNQPAAALILESLPDHSISRLLVAFTDRP